jgi:hypothetical protein
MLILTEEEWFDKYYPKEWGNWRESYNIYAYRKDEHLSGCSWLNYRCTGYASLSTKDGQMKISKRDDNPYIMSSLFSVDEDISHSFCGAKQPDNTYWVHGTIYKRESNLELYTIKLFGVDDASYSKDFIRLDNVLEGWNKVPYVLSDWANLSKEEYYFTN